MKKTPMFFGASAIHRILRFSEICSWAVMRWLRTLAEKQEDFFSRSSCCTMALRSRRASAESDRCRLIPFIDGL